jgi:SAM-dependent methyltransferase
MKQQIDWRQVWEDQSAHEAIPDFQLDRGRGACWEGIEELAAQELLAFVEPKALEVVLDAGCGTGANILRLHSRVKRIIGIDYARGCAERSRGRIRRNGLEAADVLVGSITDIPVATCSVDKVICMSVLQYLDDAEVRAALKELVRVLCDGGVLVLHVKNLSSIYFATLRLAKRLKARCGGVPRLEYVRPYEWYVTELRRLDCEIVGYNSFNLLMIERMPGRLLAWLRRFELRHYQKGVLQHPFVRRHGADLKIKARVVKGR